MEEETKKREKDCNSSRDYLQFKTLIALQPESIKKEPAKKAKKTWIVILAALMAIILIAARNSIKHAEKNIDEQKTAAAESQETVEEVTAQKEENSKEEEVPVPESTESAPIQMKENTEYSPDELLGKTIGVQLGSAADFLTIEYEANGAEVVRFNEGSEAVQALVQGTVDCVVIDAQSADALVKKSTMSGELKILAEPFYEEEYAIAVAKGDSDLKDQINTALAELKEEGILTSIEKNYIGDEDTVGLSPYESPTDVDCSNGVLVMATNATFEPYEYLQNNKIVGIDVDIAQAIADKLGMELEILDMDFDAIIPALQAGAADIGMAAMNVTEERLENVDFTDTYTTASQVIIVRQ